MSKNYYQILGVKEDASEAEIKKAYRHLARKFHPDVIQTPEAEAEFKEINRAYDTLSDPLKRADFDSTLKPAPGETEAREAEGAPSGSAASRISATAAVFLAIAAAIEFFLRWLFPESPLSRPWLYFFGLTLGATFGIMWGIDNNFDITAALKSNRFSRFYSFLRSLIFTFFLAYFLALVGAYFDFFLYDKLFFLAPLFGLIGAAIGATLGSSSETPERLSSKEGRFELFFIFLRGLEVGILGAIIGLIFGLIFLRLGYPPNILFLNVALGFILGMIAGSINPPDLSAYASYISASLKNVVVFLLVAGSLVLGLIIGASFASTFSSVFGIIWEGLLKIFNG